MNINTILDFATILKAAQSLSATIRLDELLHQLSQIILQHSGGDRCALILPNTESLWHLQALATTETTEIVSTPLDSNLSLPIKLINYVKNTGEVVVIDHLSTSLPIIDEYLITQKPQSLLCLPLLNQGKAIAILYLENRLASGVFNRDRLLILNFLFTQAAISLENAKLYQSLQQSENKFRTLVENVNDVVYTITPDGKFSYISPQCPNLLGYSVEQCLHQPFTIFTHPDDLPAVIASNQKLFATGIKQSGLELRAKHQNGHWVWLTANNAPIFDEQGNVIGLRGIVRDISDRKTTELALAESQAELLALFHAIQDVIVVLDAEGRYRKIAPTGAHLLYKPPEHMLGKTLAEVLPADVASSFLNVIQQVLEHKQMRRIEYSLTIAQQEIWFEASIVPLTDTRVVWCARDITFRKEYEERLEKTNGELIRATRLKDEFLATMSHELRTPLNAILGMTEGLQDEVFGAINPRQIQALETIEQSGYHLLELINDILDVSKIAAGKVELKYSKTPIIPLCQQSLELIQPQATKKSLQLASHLPIDLPDVSMDERRIRQVLINLLNNAVKFTPPGGKITLEACIVKGIAQHNYLRIAVSDTGIGIAPENLKRVFEPFIQIDSTLNRKYEGTGLGLALVKRIVELHGGEVTLTSELGIGSCFAIELPYLD